MCKKLKKVLLHIYVTGKIYYFLNRRDVRFYVKVFYLG